MSPPPPGVCHDRFPEASDWRNFGEAGVDGSSELGFHESLAPSYLRI